MSLQTLRTVYPQIPRFLQMVPILGITWEGAFEELDMLVQVRRPLGLPTATMLKDRIPDSTSTAMRRELAF